MEKLSGLLEIEKIVTSKDSHDVYLCIIYCTYIVLLPFCRGISGMD